MRTLALVILCSTLAACNVSSSLSTIVTPYSPKVQQGNWVTQGQVESLRVGMTKDQVLFALGTPTLADVFNAHRWEYPYRLTTTRGLIESHNLTVFFENDRLVKWEHDDLPQLQPFQVAPPPATTETENTTPPETPTTTQ